MLLAMRQTLLRAAAAALLTAIAVTGAAVVTTGTALAQDSCDGGIVAGAYLTGGPESCAVAAVDA